MEGGADSALNLRVVTTADAGGLTQTQAGITGVDTATQAATASFNTWAAAAQAASASITASMTAAAAAVRDVGGGRSWTLPGGAGPSRGGGGGSSAPAGPGPSLPPPAPAVPGGGTIPPPAFTVPGNSASETQALIELKKALAEANARVAKAEADAAEALRKAAAAAGQGAGATRIIIDAKDKTTKSEEEATKATQEGTEAQEEGSTALVDATTLIVEAHEKKKKAAEEGAQADDHAAEGSKKVGQGAITAAQFLQDMQYGFSAVTNQLPQLLTGLGMGAGLAGALSIVGVAIEAVIKHFGLFGEASNDASKQVAELSTETGKAAAAARQEEAAVNAAEAALEKHTDAIRKIETAYKDLTAAIEIAQKKRESFNRAVIAETDADLAVQLSQIAEDKESGRITEREATKRDADAKRAAAEIKYQTEQADREKRRAELIRDAEGQEKTASEKESEAKQLEGASSGLMDSEGIKSAEAELANLNQRRFLILEQRDKQMEPTPDYAGEMTVAPRNEDLTKLNQKLQDTEAKQAAISRKLEEHDEARQRSGFDDKDALNDKLKELNQQAEDARKAAIKPREEAKNISVEFNSESRRYNSSKALLDSQERLRQIADDNRQREEARKREDKDIQERRRHEDDTNRDKWDNLKKSQSTSAPTNDSDTNSKSRKKGGRSRKASKTNSARNQRSSASASSDAQRDEAKNLERTRRKEDKELEERRKEEDRKRLLPPDPQGPPMLAPGPWEGPTVTGFPGGYPTPPPPEGELQQRRQTMDNLSHVPPSADALREAADAAARSAERSTAAFESYHNRIHSMFEKIQSSQDRLADRIGTMEGQLRESRYGR